jgi:esterase/lipase
MALTAVTLSYNNANAAKERSKQFTTAKTAPMKSCNDQSRYQSLKECFTNLKEANHGFTMLKRDGKGSAIKTEYVALLVHGLSDSPYFYRDIAQVLFRRGINVVAIRTSGHGSVASDLESIKRKEWFADMAYGKKLAAKFGKKLIMAGMSLGGGLVVRESLVSKDKLYGLMLFSPTIGTPFYYKFLCTPFYWGGYEAEKEYGVGIRYQKISNNGTCETTRVSDEIYRKRGSARKPFAHLNFPVLTVLSEYDEAISLPLAFNFTKNNKSNARNKARVIYYTADASKKKYGSSYPNEINLVQIDQMKHASVLLKEDGTLFTPEGNVRFDVVEEELLNFIDDLE